MKGKTNHVRWLLCVLFLPVCVLFLLVAAWAAGAAGAGEVIYVDADATGANDGSSWANAFNYLQDALTIANSNHNVSEIWVAEGIYKPDQKGGVTPGNRGATFELINGVTLKGGYAGFGKPDPNARDIDIYETILSGDLAGNDLDVNNPYDLPTEPTRDENSSHVVTSIGTNETCVLDGFTVTGGNANKASRTVGRFGGGLLNKGGSQILINCIFSSNSAIHGGGMYNEYDGKPTVTNCTFSSNSAMSGGGMYNNNSTPTLYNCTFSSNSADDGGGMDNQYGGNLTMINCTFTGNSAAKSGGGMNNNNSTLTLYNCTFSENQGSSGHGGGMYNEDSDSSLTNCTFSGNSACDGGGMKIVDSNTVAINCIFRGNSANTSSGIGGGYGGGMHISRGSLTCINCIFSGNLAAKSYRGIYCSGADWHPSEYFVKLNIRNCILWDGDIEIRAPVGSTIQVAYSDIQGGWPGEGNIDADPLFIDPEGSDNIPGTEDDNLRLSCFSPCVNTGDPGYVPGLNETDLDGNPRSVSGRIDMGAYEFQALIYVDDDAPNDPGPGDPNVSDPLESGDEIHPVDAIQEAINTAKDGYTILVNPGVYTEIIDFMGKAITITSARDAAILEAPDDYPVSFYSGEGRDSVLKNFVIRNSLLGIFIAGSSPTISNVTIVNNKFGIGAYVGGNPDISNCILWNNTDGDLFGCEARYSCIEQDSEGKGNISLYPHFADANNGDYHLLSERGRYVAAYGLWSFDKVTSPCIEGGDPNSDYSNELTPNGSRINMGAYGGTAYASISEMWWLDGDINQDGMVNMIDMAMLAKNWLVHEKTPALNQPPKVNIMASPDNDFWPQTIGIVAVAWDVDGFVVKVEFFADGNKIGEDTDISDGWAIEWNDFTMGEHELFARATDNDGASTDSTAIEISLTMHPPKGRTCFTAETPVWVNGALVQISNVVSGQMVAKTYCDPATLSLEKIEKVQEHEGTFECRDIVLESGNRIGVVDAHCFMLDSGQWIPAQNLRSGLRLKTLNGTVGIKSVAIRAVPFVGRVYNLKIKGADRYLVGEDGVIVRDY